MDLLNDEAVQSAELTMTSGASWVDLPDAKEEEEVPTLRKECQALREDSRKREASLLISSEKQDQGNSDLRLPSKRRRLVEEMN